MATIYKQRPELFLNPIDDEQSIPSQPPNGFPKGKILRKEKMI